jgi:hypothetical protein
MRLMNLIHEKALVFNNKFEAVIDKILWMDGFVRGNREKACVRFYLINMLMWAVGLDKLIMPRDTRFITVHGYFL